MKKAILATKVGMTQIFNEDGVLTPVTVLQAGPCVVTQVKTVENDGYSAVQVGFVDTREKLVNKHDQETGTAQRTHDPRFQVPSSSGFQRCMFRSEQGIQGKRNAGPHGIKTDHHSESGDRKSRCREQFIVGKRCGTRT